MVVEEVVENSYGGGGQRVICRSDAVSRVNNEVRTKYEMTWLTWLREH